MADLFNQQISATYSGLLKTTSNGILSSSLAQITDGRGNDSPLSMSTTEIQFNTGSNTFKFPTTRGTSGQILKLADANGTLDWVADASGDVTKTGTIALNTIAVWNDNADQLRSDTTMSINTNHTISLLQPNSVPTDVNSYNIGGGNIANVTGSRNVGFGKQNLNAVLAGSDNTAMGDGSLEKVTSGNSNTGFGSDALGNSTDGDFNTAVGSGALNDVLTGENNTAVGYNAGVNVSTGSGNTYIGKSAGLVDVGSNNIYIGEGSGSSVASGNNNVILGSNTGNTISATSNNIIISDGSGNNRIQVDSGGDATFSGNVLIGTNINSDIPLQVNKETAASGTAIAFLRNTDAAGNGLVVDVTTPQDYVADFRIGNVSKMRISSGGDVGIGITPTSKLTLLGTSTAASNTPSDAIVDIKGTSTAHLLMGVANVSPYGAWINTDSTTQPLILMGTGGNVGVGNTNPSDYDSDANNLVVGSLSGNNGITILSAAASGFGSLYFADGTTVNKVNSGYIRYQQNQSVMSFGVNAAEAMRISLGGEATFTSSLSNQFIINSTEANGGYIRLQRNGTDLAWIGSAYHTISPVGANTDLALNSLSGNIVFASGSSEKMRITSGGDLKVTSGSFYNSVSGITKIGNVGDYEFLDSLGSGTRRFRPATDDAIDIGDATHRFDDIFATNGTINTSDKNQKNTILESDLGLDFINRLKPKSYKWNSKTRTHYGLISQDIESVLSDISKETKDFAGFIKSPKDIDDKNNTEFVYGLRYNEFISPMIKAIQEQQTIIEDLKARIETLEG